MCSGLEAGRKGGGGGLARPPSAAAAAAVARTGGARRPCPQPRKLWLLQVRVAVGRAAGRRGAPAAGSGGRRSPPVRAKPCAFPDARAAVGCAALSLARAWRLLSERVAAAEQSGVSRDRGDSSSWSGRSVGGRGVLRAAGGCDGSGLDGAWIFTHQGSVFMDVAVLNQNIRWSGSGHHHL